MLYGVIPLQARLNTMITPEKFSMPLTAASYPRRKLRPTSSVQSSMTIIHWNSDRDSKGKGSKQSLICIISYHIISYHIISYHIISYHIISYHIMSCRYVATPHIIISTCYQWMWYLQKSTRTPARPERLIMQLQMQHQQ